MFVDTGVLGRDGGGGVEVEGGEDGVEDVASEVTEGARAEVLPIAPDEGVVDGFVIAHGGDTDPEVPVEVGGDGKGFCGGGEEFVTFVSGDAGPRMDFFDFADETFADEAGAEAVFEVGMDLIPHLGDGARRLGVVAHLAGFPDRVGERFLAVDVFAAFHGLDGGMSVHVVGDGDGDGVDFVTEGGEHFAVVAEVAYAGKCGIGFGEAVGVDVAEADELHFWMGADLFKVGEGHAIGADGGDLELAVGGGAPGDGGEGCGEGGEAGGFEEGSSGGVHGVEGTGCVPCVGERLKRRAGRCFGGVIARA